jgi:hypothetical protein
MSLPRVALSVALVTCAGLVACAQGGPAEPVAGTEPETSEAPATPAPTQGLPAVAPQEDAGGSSSGASGSSSGGASGSSSGGASGSSSGASGSSSGGASGSSSGGASGSSSGASGSSSGASGSSSGASGSSSGATPGGDCPAGDLTYYYKAVQELAGPTPKDCPCTGATCCYGGLVCVPL